MTTLHTDTLFDQNISTALMVGDYTADVDHSSVIIDVLVDGVAGNGTYSIYLTYQVGGAGAEYQYQSPTTAVVAAGVTTIKFQSIVVPIQATDKYRVYLDGLPADTSVDTIVNFWELDRVSNLAQVTVTGTTLAAMTIRLASKVASVRYGTATGGSNTTLLDSLLSGMGESTGGVIWFLSGTAAAFSYAFGLSRTILSNPKDKFEFAALPGAITIVAGDRYAFVDKETPRDLLIAAVNVGLRQVNPRLLEDVSMVVDSEVDKYTLPAGVGNLLSVEIATSLTVPYGYYQHRHWREKGGELRFDYGYAPQTDDYKIRLTYRTDHVDLTDDEDALPVGVDEEALFWRSLIELISMLLAMRPKKQRYLDIFQEAQTEWQRRVVMPPQPAARLASW